MIDIIKKVADKAGDLGHVKDDVILLRDEAEAIMKEIGELQKLAMSLLMRQAKIIGAIGRLKAVVGLD